MISSDAPFRDSCGERAAPFVAEPPVIRAYGDGDEHALIELLGGRFSREVAVRQWRWKLRHWPANVANVWLATVGAKAVFHYGGIPLRCRLDGANGTAMISVDAMTAPDFRRRGLLTRGATRAFAEWQAHGVAFTLGLPNEQWGSRIAATGWQRLFRLQWLVSPIRLEVFAARTLRMPWLRRATIASHIMARLLRNRLREDPRIELREITEVSDGFDRLWERCKADAAFAPVRDSAWVQWRFLSSPARKYHVVLARRDGDAVGYYASHIAPASNKTSAFLAEVMAPADEPVVLESLIADAIRSAQAAGADILATLAIPGSALHALLRRAGFFSGPSFGVHIVPFSTELSMDRLREPQNWRLSGAEFDVV
jgi:hypothetical protein